MELIYYSGLNCHLAGIINIAALLGADYFFAYATLWSETDFSDETEYDILMSKRIFANLEALGIRTEALDCALMKTQGSLSQIADGGLFLAGMDIFDIPWHPVYNHFHGRHYFFAQKTAESVLCFDPIYGAKDIKIKPHNILISAFEISRVFRVEMRPPENTPAKEAEAVLRAHPGIRDKLLAEILTCKGGGKKNIAPLLKLIIAMINNRRLFGKYLKKTAPNFSEQFFNEVFYAKWEAVKNGLYKATILKDNSSVIEEVYGMFDNLMQEEIDMAKIISD